MRFVLALLTLPFLSVFAQAQEGYPNTCDPFNSCGALAYEYENGSTRSPKFPKDIKRSKALILMVLDAQLEGCSNGNADLCLVVTRDLLPLDDQDPSSPYSIWNRKNFAAAQTDGQCAEGNARACFLHIDILRYRTDGTSFGAARAMQNGTSLTDAKAALSLKEAKYVLRAETLAATQNASLRAQCAANDRRACNDLGLLLSWYAIFRTSRYEHLTYLIEACSNQATAACRPLFEGLMDISTYQEIESVPRLNLWREKLDKRCDAQHLILCDYLVLISEFDETVDIDELEAQVCDIGSPTTCGGIGQPLLRDFNRTNDPETLGHATDALTRACDLRDHYACHTLEHLSKG